MNRARSRQRILSCLALAALGALTLLVGLGSASRLTYHEAIVAQVAREMLARRAWLVPTLSGLPWLEKPPLAFWLVAVLGRLAGGIIDETIARLPSTVGALLLALAVGRLVARHRGRTAGLLAAAVQLTTGWAVIRGRLAEVDLLLAVLVAWCLVAFDALRCREWKTPADSALVPCVLARLSLFTLLGLTALAKGIGFGAALALAVMVVVLAWDRDRRAFRALLWPPGWVLAGAIALAWPLAVLARHPEAWGLWVWHVAGRFDTEAGAGAFAGESWAGYLVSPFLQVLPWTPLALIGAVRSLRRARRGRLGLDRLLWAWAVVPAVLVSLARARSAHYLIYALPPWSIWAALTLHHLGARLRRRGWSAQMRWRASVAVFALAGLAYGVFFAGVAPRFDRRGIEWAWYAGVGRTVAPDLPLVLLYDDWDRDPYPTPFGPVPHDLAVRLFYLSRPATWRFGVDALESAPPAPSSLSFAVIGRDRDQPGLLRLGRVTELSRGPRLRAGASKVDDRAFVLFRVERLTSRDAQ